MLQNLAIFDSLVQFNGYGKSRFGYAILSTASNLMIHLVTAQFLQLSAVCLTWSHGVYKLLEVLLDPQ